MTFGVTFIVFARNEAQDLILTLRSIEQAAKSLTIPVEIIAVNDGSIDRSKETLNEYFRSESNSLTKEVINQNALGISTAISNAIDYAIYSKCIPLPGHYMFDSNNLSRLIASIDKADVVIGYRSNLFSERTIAKYLSAKILKLLFYILIDRRVKDPHGLIVYPTEFLREIISADMKHENHIRALAYASRNHFSICNIPIQIRKGHKIRSKEHGRPSVPRISHLLTGLSEVINAKNIVKKSSNSPR
jgi:glycosyltransferase involved in cell wall biosynthesis